MSSAVPMRTTFVTFTLTALALVASSCHRGPGEEPLFDATCPAPSIAPWSAPERSKLDDTLAELERTLPDPVLPEVDPELLEDIDATFDNWDPDNPDRWNGMRRGDLVTWGGQVLARVEHRLHDATLDLQTREGLLEKMVRLEIEGSAGVLARLLVDEIPVDLRARAAYALGTVGGPEVLATLIFEYRVMYQLDRYYPDDYYERDEYVMLRIGEALAKRSNLTVLPYVIDLDRRAEAGEVLSMFGAEALAPIIRETWIAILREHVDDVPELGSDAPPRDLLVRVTEDLHAYWREHGYAPRERDDVPVPIALDTRLAKRLLERMLPFREYPLRPVDESRHVLGSLGVLPLDVLRVGLEDPNLFVREYTLNAVERLGPPAARLAPDVEALLGSDETRLPALDALATMGSLPDVSRWCGLALVPDAEIRLQATLALGGLRAQAALPYLRRARERYPVASFPETTLALAYALTRLAPDEGLDVWSSLRSHLESVDPIRLQKLAVTTYRDVFGSDTIGPFTLEAFWDAIDRRRAESTAGN